VLLIILVFPHSPSMHGICKDRMSSTPRPYPQNKVHGRKSNHPRDSLMQRSNTLRIRVTRTHALLFISIISPSDLHV
jgi:hypothetical protein